MTQTPHQFHSVQCITRADSIFALTVLYIYYLNLVHKNVLNTLLYTRPHTRLTQRDVYRTHWRLSEINIKSN